MNWANTGYDLLGMSAFSKELPGALHLQLQSQHSARRGREHDLRKSGCNVGSLSHRLPTWYEGDPITAAGHAGCLADPVCSTDPALIHEFFPQYTANPVIVPGTGGGVISSLPNGNSVVLVGCGAGLGSALRNYVNSLQASLKKAPTHGLQFTVAYTYSHALDNSSGYESATERQIQDTATRDGYLTTCPDSSS